MKHRQQRRPACGTGRGGRDAHEVDGSAAAEAGDCVGDDEGAFGGGFCDAVPGEFALALEPDAEVFGGAGGVEGVELVADGAGLGDEASETDGGDDEGGPGYCCSLDVHG